MVGYEMTGVRNVLIPSTVILPIREGGEMITLAKIVAYIYIPWLDFVTKFKIFNLTFFNSMMAGLAHFVLVNLRPAIAGEDYSNCLTKSHKFLT